MNEMTRSFCWTRLPSGPNFPSLEPCSDFSLTDEPHSALQKLATTENQKKEAEKKAGPKPSEHRTSHLSQAHLLAGAVKRRRYKNDKSPRFFKWVYCILCD